MADQWLHMYHQNHLPNDQLLPFHLSDNDQQPINDNNNNTGLLSDSTVVASSRVVKPVRKRSRASRRTPTTLLNTDPANFRAMVQQFTGGPSNANNSSNFAAFGLPGNSNAVFDPTVADYHLAAPPQPFRFQNQPTPPLPPFMLSALGNSAASEAFFQPTLGGGSRNNNNTNVDYMGPFDGSSPAA